MDSIPHFGRFEKPKRTDFFDILVIFQEERMRTVSVICEYNPFHRGHAHHLSRAQAQSGADYVVCVMSGCVTQRGAFARHDKWTRARMALLHGADLVIELPTRFACASAQEFAAGGVSLLDSLGVLTHLSFGCEAQALPLLSEALTAFDEADPRFRSALLAGLDAGLSYPKARALAAGQSGAPADLIAMPNATLALEYLRALPPHVAPVPVVREGAGYHDETLGALASATAIRRAIESDRLEEALCAVAEPEMLREAEERGEVCPEEALTQALLYCLRTAKPDALEPILGMDEGLQHRFFSAARTAQSREELLSLVKTKRYTYARLSRTAMYALLGVHKEFASACQTPTYARILGFRRDAAPLLRAIKEHATLPVVTKTADYDVADPLFALDLRAQDLWSLGCKNPDLRRAGRDFVTSPVIVS